MQRSRNKRQPITEARSDVRDHAGGLADGVRDIGEAVKDAFIEKLRTCSSAPLVR
jgi:hypothetical protein